MKNYEKAYKEALKVMESLYNVKYHSSSDALLTTQTIENAFPELKESEDEKIRKLLVSLVENWKVYNPKSPFADYPIYCDNIEECDKILAWLEKQKPNKDMVEPKFKVGDFVVYNNGNTYQVKEISDKRYELMDHFGDILSVPMCWEKSLHLWTIEDARNGDVLTCYSDIKGQPIEQTGIIKQYVGRRGGCSNSFKAHFGVDWDNNVVIEGYMGSSNIYPSTKEQRDSLFQKMKEAGYEWDGEKKELKKIEKKPSWSEEDEKFLNYAISLTDDAQIKNFLKSLKDRVQPQPKQKWSEEDKANMDAVWKACGQVYGVKYQSILGDWLKSLKPHWKPSEEQMEALNAINLLGELSYVGQGGLLVKLYQDLKKL